MGIEGYGKIRNIMYLFPRTGLNLQVTIRALFEKDHCNKGKTFSRIKVLAANVAPVMDRNLESMLDLSRSLEQI